MTVLEPPTTIVYDVPAEFIKPKKFQTQPVPHALKPIDLMRQILAYVPHQGSWADLCQKPESVQLQRQNVFFKNKEKYFQRAQTEIFLNLLECESFTNYSSNIQSVFLARLQKMDNNDMYQLSYDFKSSPSIQSFDDIVKLLNNSDSISDFKYKFSSLCTLIPIEEIKSSYQKTAYLWTEKPSAKNPQQLKIS
ncbi:hypothetical protein RCL1_006978 [Eukaryota sp. TZLM3-RCL]